MEYNLTKLGIMVAIVSFLGFLVENIWLAFTKGYIDNRNMNAPFLLGYGLTVLFLLLVLGIPSGIGTGLLFKKSKSKRLKVAVYFICVFILVCIGEIILGKLTERLCGFEYWNYSAIPLHITKYTSVPTSCGFALMITFFMEKCALPLMSWIGRFDSVLMSIISTGFMMIMLSDFIYSFYHMITSKDFYRKWRIEIKDLKIRRKICRKSR